VIKTRVMNDSQRLYRSPLDCITKTLRNEGPKAFSASHRNTHECMEQCSAVQCSDVGVAWLAIEPLFLTALTSARLCRCVLWSLASPVKGWVPNYLRLGPHFIVSLPLAEFIRVKLGAESM